MTDSDKPKRGPGRPKGLGKVPGSGRKPGTPNKDRAATIARIMTEADPLGFLCKVANGDRMSAASEVGGSAKSWWVPTGDQRITAAQTLLRKTLPDLKATELTGDVLPTFTKIEYQIVDSLPRAPEAAEALTSSSTGNGADESGPDCELVREDGALVTRTRRRLSDKR